MMPTPMRVTAALAEFDSDVPGRGLADAFGLIVPSTNGFVTFHARCAWGAAAYEFSEKDVSQSLPIHVPTVVQLPLASRLDPARPFDALLVQFGAAFVLLVSSPVGTFWVASPRRDPWSGDEVRAYTAIAERLAEYAESRESVDERLARLEHIDLLEQLSTTLAGALEVRDVFARLATIVERVLPHDAFLFIVLSDDRRRARLYARVGFEHPGLPDEIDTPAHMHLADWRYVIVDDLRAMASEAAMPPAAAGLRSSLRVPIVVRDRLLGGIDVMSRALGRYRAADVHVALRLAQHIALTLSHQRLAEEARRTAELQSRATNLELLEHSLAFLTDAGEWREFLDRMSTIARTVLPHDALVLSVLLQDVHHARQYVSSGVPAGGLLAVSDVLQDSVRDPDWQHDLIDDVTVQPEPNHVMAAAAGMGFRSVLRVPVRLDGQLVAALAFLSRTPGAHHEGDVQVARRMADRIALSLTRERGLEATRRADEATERATRLESRVRRLTDELDARTGYRRVIGESRPWREVLTLATQAAAAETTVLLLGESGTGKEVVARFVHRASPRRDGPFVALNCAALPEHLLEAELFGFERGAFTGATQTKPGQIEQAAGGVLFLDEVGEMTPSAQAKFLRVLQEREFQRLGGTRVLRADVRVVAATNRDLKKAIERGGFREDLYYRLNVFALRLPPLRERPDDILPLSEAFITEIGRNLGRPPSGISREARQSLLAYGWPGNVRELRNVLERAAILADGGLVVSEHLALSPVAAAVAVPPPTAPAAAVATTATMPADIKLAERAMLEKALQDARFNKSVAAKSLGLTRAQLYVRLKRHGLP
jgi:transcriptional regulator with GAF, ATPase, and Fis domain